MSTRTTSTRTPRRKDPQGGLTAAGRAFFREKEGAHLKPGVKGKADTPEKMRRKGSFLRRHFAHPRGPMKDENGKPTRLALSAHAWGEPVPRDAAGARRLAAKGTRLLERYQATQQQASTAKKSGTKTTRRTVSAKTSRARKSTPVRSRTAPARRKSSSRARK